MASDQQLERIKWLIADQQGFPAERITLDTRLQADTGMAGDDGYNFLKRFEEEFAVDMDTLRYDEHFEPEGLSLAVGFAFALMVGTSCAWPWLIPAWALALYFYFRRSSRTEHPGEIRVSDVLRSAEAHHWTYDYKAA
jgi:hypothetical protein